MFIAFSSVAKVTNRFEVVNLITGPMSLIPTSATPRSYLIVNQWAIILSLVNKALQLMKRYFLAFRPWVFHDRGIVPVSEFSTNAAL